MGRRLCHRFGPGRLPYASRRDIGGGIAMAATGLLAAVLWFAGALILNVTGTVNGTLGFFTGVGLFFLPLAIPASFVVGTILWRKLYSEEHRQLSGAIFGGITSVSCLAIGSVGPGMYLALANTLSGEMVAVEATRLALAVVLFGFPFAIFLAGWLVIPLGIFGGWYHERAKQAPQ